MFKRILQSRLKNYARQIIAKYQPEVIGITGSVGKTGAKEAVYQVLSGNFAVRQSVKNYNNEIGVPLTIIGCDSAGRSVTGWSKVFKHAKQLLQTTDKNYPKILILEMGVDRPGDMDYLLSIVQPKIGIITAIGQSHLEFLKTNEGVAKEKGKLIDNINIDGWAVLNYDDAATAKLSKRTKGKIITYGLSNNAEVSAQEVHFSDKADQLGTRYKLCANGSVVPVWLPGAVGEPPVLGSLIGAAVGLIYGLNSMAIAHALAERTSVPGRLHVLPGQKNSLLLDDTYNAAPQSMTAAFKALNSFDVKRERVLVLGDMLELGPNSHDYHKAVGDQVAKLKPRLVIFVGEQMRQAASAAISAGMTAKIAMTAKTSEEAATLLKKNLKTDDIVLIKGSQGMRLEKVVKAVLKNPKQSGELVRQGREWN